MSPFWGHDPSAFRALLHTAARTRNARRAVSLFALMSSRWLTARLQSVRGVALVRAQLACWMRAFYIVVAGRAAGVRILRIG